MRPNYTRVVVSKNALSEFWPGTGLTPEQLQGLSLGVGDLIAMAERWPPSPPPTAPTSPKS